ncbi:unnamed protein product [Durusdinium trenchii]|uniref:Uncharacterized protein n=2 Tax=Durusdinium trenchii TaxID=1381693 RepID=A0ABP0M320_9DINO
MSITFWRPCSFVQQKVATPTLLNAERQVQRPSCEEPYRVIFGAGLAFGALGFWRPRVVRNRQKTYQVGLAATGSTIETLEQADLTEEELLAIFKAASKGRDKVTFEQAASLEGVDAVLEEGAANLEELKVIWGNPEDPLDFDAFCGWYNDVLKLYDAFLWQDAVAPPSELLIEEESAEDLRALSDEQLLEDAPAIGVKVQDLKTVVAKPAQEMKYGTLTDQVPVPTKSPKRRFEEEMARKQGKEPDETYGVVEDNKPLGSTAGLATPSAGGGRENVQITQLFRQACDESNLLSFESLKEISEISDMLASEDLAEEELLDMWEGLPKKKGDYIDVLAFRDLLAKVDELFEYVEEDEDEDPANEALMQLEGGGIAKAKKRSLQTVKQELLDAINRLEAIQDKPCGLGSTEEADGEVIKLAGELEDIWRDQVGDLNEFDGAKLAGLWELVYSTSVKFRRWGSVLNAVRDIKDAKFEALIQNFAVSADDGFNEYDMEEVFKAQVGEEVEEMELSMRGQGSWKLGIQQNVVTGEEDLVVKIEVTGVEYDTPEDTVENCGEKTVMSPMCRTFSYAFISYMDDSVRVMRTSLTGRSLYVFQRIDEAG